jgi:hypothetical protein
MRHASSLEGNDCGVCVAEMLSECDYTTAFLMANVVVPNWPTRGLSSVGLICLLERLAPCGDRYHFKRLGYPRPLVADFEWPDERAALVIRGDKDKGGHWIAWEPHGKRVHDPDWHCSIPLRTYREWIRPDVRVIGIITAYTEEPPDRAA